MPTFFDSTADAAEASEALRGLAHASRTFDQPAQMYGVIGELSSGLRSLHQVLEQKDCEVGYSAQAGAWSVRYSEWSARQNVKVTQEFGTSRLNAGRRSATAPGR